MRAAGARRCAAETRAGFAGRSACSIGQAMPTPAQLKVRIDRHRDGGTSASPSPDASQALFEALAELAPLASLVGGDRQRLDREARRTVHPKSRRAVNRDIGDDLARDTEFGVFEPSAHALGNGPRARTGNPQLELVPLAGQGQRLPVDDWTSVSKILSRETCARPIRARRSAAAAGDMVILIIAQRLQIGADPRDGPRPRIAAVPQIEDKSRISNSFSSETGRSRVILA